MNRHPWTFAGTAQGAADWQRLQSQAQGLLGQAPSAAYAALPQKAQRGLDLAGGLAKEALGPGAQTASGLLGAAMSYKPETTEIPGVMGDIHKAIDPTQAGYGTAMYYSIPVSMAIVPPAAWKGLNIAPKAIPGALKQAAKNTPGTVVNSKSLKIPLHRAQRPEQAMSNSVRGSVMYLPSTRRGYNYKTKPGTLRNERVRYGGSQEIAGETEVVAPLAARGGTGGRVPKEAYDNLVGKGAYEKMRREALDTVTRVTHDHHAHFAQSNARLIASNARGFIYEKKTPLKERVYNFLEKHAPEMSSLTDDIIANSKWGNQLEFALQEAAVASKARKAGYDSVVGWNYGRGANKGKPFITEVMDIRENRYPGPGGEYSVWPDLLKK